MRGSIKTRIKNHIKICKSHIDWIDREFLVVVKKYSVSQDKYEVEKYNAEIHKLIKRRAEISNRLKFFIRKLNK
jgi:hypothetical protein